MVSLITKLVAHNKKGVDLNAEISAQGSDATIAKVVLLSFIADADRCVTEVANYLGQTPQSVGVRFRKLEATGFIKSYKGKDKRQKFVEITAKGRKVLTTLN